MSISRSLVGVLLLGTLCLSGQQPKAKSAPKPHTAKAAPQKAAPASAGAVIVKDWESGPGATRAAQPGDFPVENNSNLLRTGQPQAVLMNDGSLEYAGPELMTSMTATKSANGTISYSCNLPGDHAKHNHAAVSQTPAKVEEK